MSLFHIPASSIVSMIGDAMTHVQYKIIGEICLVIPTVLLTLLGVGEIVGGDMSGVQHFFQLTPLLILGVLSWFYPKYLGYFLLISALILGLWYMITFNRFPLASRIINALLLFGFPCVSGITFIKGGAKDSSDTSSLDTLSTSL